MTIDEAIKWFEDELSGGKCSPDCVRCNANEMALNALRYQQAMMGQETTMEQDKRLIPRTPELWGDGFDDDGNIILDSWNCPNCKGSYEVDYDKYKYCPECGQAIDWSDEE